LADPEISVEHGFAGSLDPIAPAFSAETPSLTTPHNRERPIVLHKKGPWARTPGPEPLKRTSSEERLVFLCLCFRE
jgi:hypothetical protein